MKPYPEKIRNLSYWGDKDYSDRIPIFISTSQRGYPIIETPDGRFKPTDEIHLLTFLATHRHFFTCCSEGELDSLFAFLDPDDLYDLSRLGSTGMYSKYPLAIAIKIKNKKHYVWNIGDFLAVAPKDLDELDILTTYLLGFYKEHGIPLTTLWSTGAVARNFFLSYPEVVGEINQVRKLPTELLQHFYGSCIGQRHETDRLGSENQYHYDLKKAHLNILMTMPSITGLTISQDTYDKDTALGSYLIRATIPQGLKFAPLGVRDPDSSKNYYIHGEVMGAYQKPTIDFLKAKGFQVEVITSYEFHGSPINFTGRWVSDIKRLLEHPANKILSLKYLYNTVAGGTVSCFETINPKTGELLWEANPTFWPALYGFTTANVNTTVLNLAYELGEKARALRADEISCSERLTKVPKGFEEKQSGETTYLNHLLKHLPDGSTLPIRDYINRFPNRSYIEFDMYHVVTLNSSPFFQKRPGTPHEFRRRISPSHSYREGGVPDKVGALLNNTFTSSVIGEKLEYEEPNWMRFL